MQKFNYVNEQDLTQMNIVGRVVHLLSNETWLRISFIACLVVLIIAIIFAISTWGFKRDLTKRIPMSKRSLNSLIVCGVLIPIIALGIESYVLNTKYDYIGHYETKGEVIGFGDSTQSDEKSALIKSGDKEQPTKVKIPSNKSFEKGDEVIVKTATNNYSDRPASKMHTDVELSNQKIFAEKQ